MAQSPSKPLRYRVHALVDTLNDPQLDDDERVRRARQVLRHGSRDAITALFVWYQRRRADGRWGVDNPLDEILGVLRIAAVDALRGSPGPQARHHEEALGILWSAAKPRDLPLLTALLGSDVSDHAVCWAIDHALADDPALATPALVAALEARVRRDGVGARYAVRTLGACVLPEATSALVRLADGDVWLRGLVLEALLHRQGGRWVPEAREALAALESCDPEQHPWLAWDLRRAIDEAEQPAAPPDVYAEDRLSAFVAALAAAPPGGRAAVLASLGPEALYATTSFFSAVWPLTSSDDDDEALAAVRACASTGSSQAIARLRRRARLAAASGETRTARLTEQGLREGREQNFAWYYAAATAGRDGSG